MTEPKHPTGTVLSYQSNFYQVLSQDQVYQCFLKGTLKKEGQSVLVGDHVGLDSLDESNFSARIIDVVNRQSQLERPKVANISMALVVAAIKSPDLNLEQLDRYLTHIQLQGVQPAICLTKMDLCENPTEFERVQAIYTPLGLQVFSTSIKQPQTVHQLFQTFSGQTFVLAGQSGVGKSSLLNTVRHDLQLAVQSVSEKNQRGTHTTRSVSLIALGSETYVADAPGFSLLKFNGVEPLQIERAFPEFETHRGQCRFDNCLHIDEAACHVLENKAAIISPSRYAGYQQFISEAQALKEWEKQRDKKADVGSKTLDKAKDQQRKIVKLTEKQRQHSRRRLRQETHDWTSETDPIE